MHQLPIVGVRDALEIGPAVHGVVIAAFLVADAGLLLTAGRHLRNLHQAWVAGIRRLTTPGALRSRWRCPSAGWTPVRNSRINSSARPSCAGPAGTAVRGGVDEPILLLGGGQLRGCVVSEASEDCC